MWKKLPCTACLLFAYGAHASTIGVVGGSELAPLAPGDNTPYGARLNSSLALEPVPPDLLPGPPNGYINSVDINDSRFSVLAGSSGVGGHSYCLLYDPSGNPTIAQPSQTGLSIFSVATNASSHSIMAGGNGNQTFVKVDPTGVLTAVIGLSQGTLTSTDINDSGLATATGGDAKSYLIFPDNTLLLLQGAASSTSINNAGNSIFVGNNLCTLYNSSGAQIAQTSITNATLASVSLTDTGLSLVGGTLQSVHPYAALIDLSGNVSPVPSSSLPNLGKIVSVSFSELGIGIIGGQDSTGAYAAYLYPNGFVYPLPGLPTGSNASIQSVSINDWGMALLGGTTDGTNAYAALATPWGQVIPLLNNSPAIVVRSVAIANFVPTMLIPAITGNNLLFAQYLNQYARKKLLYFLPSLSEQTFPEALQLATPTRNALSLFSVANNFFFLNHSLSAHLRNYRHTPSRFRSRQAEISLLASGLSVQNLADSLNTLLPEDAPSSLPANPPRKPSYSLWLQAIGAYINQKEQDQTVANNPAIGGAILGFEPLRTERGRFGLGAAYTFTRIHEDQEAGACYINQEYAFLYGSWANKRCYFDAALWGGLFQTRQTRLIDIPGFSFHASSRPTGYEASPHAELGCSKPFDFGDEKQHQFILDLFGMADWPNVWQSSYKENGNGPFNARQTAQYASFLRAETGFRFYETFRGRCLLFTLQEKISYVYKRPFHIGTIAGALVGSPGSFTLETFTETQNLGAAEFTLILEPLHSIHPSVSLSYQGEYCSTYNSQQLTFDLTWNF